MLPIPRYRLMIILLLLVLSTTLACEEPPRRGKSPVNVDGDTSLPDISFADVVEEVDWNNESPEGLGLAVIRTARTEVIDSTEGVEVVAAAGSVFVTIDLKLRNLSAASVPLAASHFSLNTTGGLEFPGAGETALHARGCPQSANVSAGAETGCTVVFTMPSGDEASLVTYTPPAGESVSRALVAEGCTTCGARCVDLQESRTHCGACGQSAGDFACVDGQIQCGAGLTLCGSECVNLDTSPHNCGACGWSVGDGTCANGEAVCGRFSLNCDNKCVSPERLETCGSCERNCPAAIVAASLTCDYWSMEEAYCEATVRDRTADCDSVCGLLECVRAEAYYANSNGGGRIIYYECSEVPPETYSDGNSELPFENKMCKCE